MSAKGFSREFKLAALGQIEAGETIARVARDLGVSRKTIYQWQDQFRKSDVIGSRDPSGAFEQASPTALPAELIRARKRIAELERKIGQQQAELDFFRGAWLRIRASHPESDRPGVTNYSPTSRR